MRNLSSHSVAVKSENDFHRENKFKYLSLPRVVASVNLELRSCFEYYSDIYLFRVLFPCFSGGIQGTGLVQGRRLFLIKNKNNSKLHTQSHSRTDLILTAYSRHSSLSATTI
jgi:hypothetical protein